MGLIINMIAGLFLGKNMYWACLTYTGMSVGFFVIKTLSATSSDASDKKRRKLVILIAGAMQLVLMWWLGYSRDLNHSTKAAVVAAVEAAAVGAAATGTAKLD